MKIFLLFAAASALAFAAPGTAQTMGHSNMPGMKMPAKPATKPKPAAKPRAAAKPAAKPAPRATPPVKPADAQTAPAGDPTCPPEHAEMGHCTPSTPASPTPAQADSHAGHDMSAMPGMAAGAQDMGTGGTALPAGDAPAPAAPEPSYADRVWGREAMMPARETLRSEHGGGKFSQIMFNLAEYQVRDGRDGFRWDGEGWFGGDINRFVVKSEGSGAFGEGVEDAEIQALYSRAIGPYFNLQAGIRYDFKPNPSRTYATIGFEGLAPYWFEVEGALFLSDKGDVLARLEGYYDQRITQRLILQPRAEFNLAAQDVPENGIGSGLSDIELGLRLRYEIAREFAPYVGISYDRKIGETADFARAAGENPSSTSLVLGVRAWF
ncbi:copper resistance protein B [Edaphosphingomonas haloaromaticamans]|jgi:copper resistance protein B|uniref:Copper resistance protein B n=1 Tax=Edaphosphingomonas haloaromaticamans TaxID=653954 RepID=A0A1S1HB20_9SPHN|nr:copper resistance protein B [Sphingomonas haloaromaticamans]OHT18836.1 Copper resistance protein B precursor [Sphingomonas haloaromaticamans]